MDTRLPEDSEIPGFGKADGYEGKDVVIELGVKAVAEGGGHQNAPVRRDPQKIAAKQGKAAQKTHEHHILPGRFLRSGKEGDEHGGKHAVNHAEIHHLPVPLQGHGDEEGQAEEKGQNNPAIGQKLRDALPVVKEQRQGSQSRHTHGKELGTVKAQKVQPCLTVPGQVHEQKEIKGKQRPIELPPGEGVTCDHRASFFCLSRMTASSRCCAPGSTAIPPWAWATSWQAVPL